MGSGRGSRIGQLRIENGVAGLIHNGQHFPALGNHARWSMRKIQPIRIWPITQAVTIDY